MSARELLPNALPRWLATGLGSGLSPIMPGTAGSLVAVGLALVIPSAWWPWAPLGAALLATIACQRLAARFPTEDKRGDPSWFVLDEWAGQWLAMALLPPNSWSAVLVPFVLFRIFDMWKPFPLRSLERIPAGWGIVADDLGAGLYALILSWPVMQWLPTI